MDDNVMRRYTTPQTEQQHFIQYDQIRADMEFFPGKGSEEYFVLEDGVGEGVLSVTLLYKIIKS